MGMLPARQSLICNEYLEECHPHAAMLPRDPVARAHARIVIDRFNSKYVPVFYRFLIRCRPGAVRLPIAVMTKRRACGFGSRVTQGRCCAQAGGCSAGGVR